MSMTSINPTNRGEVSLSASTGVDTISCDNLFLTVMLEQKEGRNDVMRNKHKGCTGQFSLSLASRIIKS